MLKAQLQLPHYLASSSQTLLHKPFSHLNLSLPSGTFRPRRVRKNARVCRFRALSNIRAVATEQTTSVKAVVTAKTTVSGAISEIAVKGLDDIQDLLGKSLLLELVSSELDPNGAELGHIKGYVHRTTSDHDEVKYESDIVVPAGFKVGAVLVENEHHKEMFLKNIVLHVSTNDDPVNINCNSWVASKFDTPDKRVFFVNKSYLPGDTPNGLTKLRKEELEKLRGDGKGERKTMDRIYDYDVYNDIGAPDSSPDLKRPVLGGKEFPYPRRCRTGRGPSKTDPASESRSTTVYVPRDESFSEVKELTFGAKTVYSVLHAVVPAIESVVESESGFPYLTDIDDLFKEGVSLPNLGNKGSWKGLLPRLLKSLAEEAESILKFETPIPMIGDKLFWFRDEEFARQTLAGLNPYSLQLITEWPLKSALDPTIYGPAESSITTQVIEKEIGGGVTVAEALEDKKLFILDYHDLLMPYVEKVRGLKGTTLYGSRTVFYLTEEGTLRPLAIELTRPPMGDKPFWNHVYTPAWHATGVWLWRLAKSHVLAHDAGYHQLVSHWLRTHCCTEPYIIAMNRQLSALHPIYKLMHPHFRYTMEINALAREALINAGGIIESSFSPAKYSIELSSVAYDKQWQFDLQALPADLISRGMAVKDPRAPHGLKLAIEDYPFANDGLILWDTIKEWVSEYVNHYYPNAGQVESDEELQAWWTEVRTVGHGDKKDSPGWPELKTNQNLIQVITTIVWVTSGHHAAVNFGQYHYGGYFPNRPTIARTNMPNEDGSEEDLKQFLRNPEAALLNCFPSQLQATTVMAILDVLSSHSVDEEYLGEYMEPGWMEEPEIKSAFDKFNVRLKELEQTVDKRNADLGLKNRTGAGVAPYELLKPFSEPGVTGRGVPYSISI